MPRTPPPMTPVMAVEEITKPDLHHDKVKRHSVDRDRVALHHLEAKGATRVERHSANGHTLHERPKKDGAGRGNWGTWKDAL